MIHKSKTCLKFRNGILLLLRLAGEISRHTNSCQSVPRCVTLAGSLPAVLAACGSCLVAFRQCFSRNENTGWRLTMSSIFLKSISNFERTFGTVQLLLQPNQLACRIRQAKLLRDGNPSNMFDLMFPTIFQSNASPECEK